VTGTLHFDYTTVGHVTIDVLSDGTRQPGGAAFYGALQAARLGQRTQILTRGVPAEIEGLLEPYRGELELQILPAPATTTLVTSGSGASRAQRLRAWAGPIESVQELDTTILHLAPVAREIPLQWAGQGGFLGLTPQGLARRWSGLEDELRLSSPEPASAPLGARADAVVISALERDSCAALLAAARAAGAVVVITDGERPSTILCADGSSAVCPVPSLADAVEDLGAGDVFAAALFIALREGRAPEAAVQFATAAAAVRIGARGAGTIGDRARIEARLQEVGWEAARGRSGA
jgi:sugar/nucleoside kinase (ribokinase family)